jgi:glycosyltransferase involved in cell wall biosynthesis
MILDDDSHDESPAIVASFDDSRVRYSRNPERMGLFRTLNRGFAEAASPWVRIWAHDDRMIPDCLAQMAELALKSPSAGMMYCNFTLIDSQGRRTEGETKYLGQYRRTPTLAPPELSALLFFAFGCLPGNISTVMLRRDAWKSVGGFWEGKQQAPDYDMWVRVSEAWDVAFLDKPLVELREHEHQLGRAGQKLMTTIAEEFRVVDALHDRLRHLIPDREWRRFWRDNRGRQHFHWIVRALVRGDFTLAKDGWFASMQYGTPYSQAWKWLATLNGRILGEQPAEFFDRYVARVQAIAGSEPKTAVRPQFSGGNTDSGTATNRL